VFDLCARQLAQERVPEGSRGRVNGQWNALIALCDMSSFGLAVRYDGEFDCSSFGRLFGRLFCRLVGWLVDWLVG